jgi:hypothetical protein
LGDHPFLEALFSDAGDVVGEEKEEEQPQDVGRQGIGKVACVWSWEGRQVGGGMLAHVSYEILHHEEAEQGRQWATLHAASCNCDFFVQDGGSVVDEKAADDLHPL